MSLLETLIARYGADFGIPGERQDREGIGKEKENDQQGVCGDHWICG